MVTNHEQNKENSPRTSEEASRTNKIQSSITHWHMSDALASLSFGD